MDQAPTSTTATARLIAMAVCMVGDSQELIEQMKCSQSDFLDYSAGRRWPNGPEMERLVELILREAIIVAKDRDLVGKVRAKSADK